MYYPSDGHSFHAFVVDTEQYAGNFERPMVAYMTGQVGECGVGDKEAAMFKAEEDSMLLMMMEEDILQMPDDSGCMRPASIYATPGWFNDSMGSEYPDSEWGKSHVKNTYRQACKKDKIKPGKMTKCPAYMSVAAFFSTEPPEARIYLMKTRARAFANMWDKDDRAWHGKITITGFRLVHSTQQETEREV